MTGPESFESTNSLKKTWMGAPMGYTAKYLAYSANVKMAKASEKASDVNAGCVIGVTRSIRLTMYVVASAHLLRRRTVGEDTHVDGDRRNKHHDGEHVEKLAPKVERDVHPPVASDVTDFHCIEHRPWVDDARCVHPASELCRVLAFGQTQPSSANESSLPSANGSRGDGQPVECQKYPPPASPSLEEVSTGHAVDTVPAEQGVLCSPGPSGREAASQRPACPAAEGQAYDHDQAREDSQSSPFPVATSFFRPLQAMRRPLSKIARQHEERCQQETRQEGTWYHYVLVRN